MASFQRAPPLPEITRPMMSAVTFTRNAQQHYSSPSPWIRMACSLLLRRTFVASSPCCVPCRTNLHTLVTLSCAHAPTSPPSPSPWIRMANSSSLLSLCRVRSSHSPSCAHAPTAAGIWAFRRSYLLDRRALTHQRHLRHRRRDCSWPDPRRSVVCTRRTNSQSMACASRTTLRLLYSSLSERTLRASRSTNWLNLHRRP